MLEPKSVAPFSPRGEAVVALREALELHMFHEVEGLPSRAKLAEVLNALFRASLRTEEGVFVRLAVAVLSEDTWPAKCIRFQEAIPYSTGGLTKLSAGARSDDVCLALEVGPRSALLITGICLEPVTGVKVRAMAPGHLVVYANRDVIADFVPGGAPRVFREPGLWRITMPSFLGDLGLSKDESWGMMRHLRWVAKAMQHGRGGTLLIVPSEGRSSWSSSVEVKYRVTRDSLGIERAHNAWSEESERSWKKLDPGSEGWYYSIDTKEERTYKRVVNTIGLLTAIDGATIVTRAFEVLGLGAKIRRVGEKPEAIWQWNVVGGHRSDVEQVKLSGGTRHGSAAQFASDNEGTLALVASQDGGLSLFGKAELGVQVARGLEMVLH